MTLSPARRNVIFALAITATLLNLVDRQIIAVLKPDIAHDMSWTDNDYGTLAAWFQGSAAVAFLFTGFAVDKLGVKWANPIGVALWSLAAMAHAFARGFSSFVLCRIALGATEAMGTPAAIKTIAVIFPPTMRSFGYGLVNTVGSLGAIVTPLLIPTVALLWGWRAAFLIGGALGLLWAIVWLFAVKGVHFAGDGAPTRSDQGAKTTVGRSIFVERRTWAIAVAKFLSDATWWLMLFWMPDFFHRSFGLTGIALGTPLAIAYTCSAIGSLIAGTVASRLIRQGYSVEKVRKGSLLVAALLALPLPFADTVHSYALAVALIGLVMAAHQAFSVNLFALIADVSRPEKIGRVTSFGAFSGNIGGMVIAKVAGLTLAAGLGYLPLFLFAGGSYLLAVIAIQLLLPKLPLDGMGTALPVAAH
ncbi:MFS transporter [Sphingomonas sp. So64.6b]|uniref:MFS transporter n=1 Tax=Sphingomonas sp. So64.6b TaxID=2997354 RepID=UPI00160388AB|nr:MFS transporter [Sphingomonas sp. So64.6b]QNA86106.1 MFS transporter [Sphingomonas sp. So64.6b]